MTEKSICPKCHRRIPAGARHELCPACIFALASEPPREFAGFTLDREIGRGAMGTVHRALHPDFTHPVALKLIDLGPKGSEDRLLRFRTEVEAATRLNHPNIVRLLRIGEQGGTAFLCMELIEGLSLADRLASDQPGLSNREAAEMIRVVASAVHYAHQRGVLHRDLKPGNILIDQNGKPHLTDFGLAKIADTDFGLTQTGNVLGTLAYMSPEQAQGRGRETTAASDVFSLGAILYELIARRPAFRGATRSETLQKVVHEEPIPPLECNPAASEDLQTICLQCLQKQPEHRYQSAGELARDLDRWLDGRPIAARPTSAFQRVIRWVGRNRRVAGLYLALAVSLVVGALASFYLNQRTQYQIRLQQFTERARANLEDNLMLKRAEESFSSSNAQAGISMLAEVLQRNPSNRIATERLLSALTMRNFALPVSPPIDIGEAPKFVTFNQRGDTILVAGEAGSVSVLNAQTSEPLFQAPHRAPIVSAAFSQDGRLLITAADKTVRILDARTGEPMTPQLDFGSPLVHASVSSNGEHVVTLTKARVAEFWRISAGNTIALRHSYSNQVELATLSSTGDRLLVVTAENGVSLVDVHTGGQIGPSFLHPTSVMTADLASDAQMLVTCDTAGVVRVWDLATGQLRHDAIKNSAGRIQFAAFSPDAQRIVTRAKDRTVRWWNAKDGSPIVPPLLHDDTVQVVEFGPDGLIVASGAFDWKTRLFDAQTGELLTEPIRHNFNSMAVGFSSDRQRLVTGSYYGAIRVWDIRPRNILNAPWRYNDWVVSAAFTRDGNRFLTASRDGVVHVRDSVSRQILVELPRQEEGLLAATFRSADTEITTCSKKGRVRLWSSRTGDLVKEYVATSNSVRYAEFSQDGERLIAVWADGGVFFNVRSGQSTPVATPPIDQHFFADFSADGRHLCLATFRNEVQLYDVSTGIPFAPPLRHRGPENAILTAEFSPDGTQIVTAAFDGTAVLWDLKSQAQLARFKHFYSLTHARFSTDGRRVVTTSFDKTARVWDAHTARPVTGPLEHQSIVYFAGFSSDGRRVFTVSADDTARVWDSETGLPVTEPLRHSADVRVATLSPKGDRLLSRSMDRTATLWDLPQPDAPAPEWLRCIADVIAGDGSPDDHSHDTNTWNRYVILRDRLQHQPATNYFTRWGKWFFSDPDGRTINPWSSQSANTFLEDEIRAIPQSGWRHAVLLSPTNGIAMANLASALETSTTNASAKPSLEAAFWRRRAVQFTGDTSLVPNVRPEATERRLPHK